MNLTDHVQDWVLIAGRKGNSRNARTLTKQKAFLSLFPSLDFDDAAAEVYGLIRGELEMKGTPIGPNDLLIAAIAVVNGLTLVTRNSAEFSRIKGLLIEDWEN